LLPTTVDTTMMKAKMQGKICMFGVAEGSCLSLHARLHAIVVVSASLEARLPSKGAMRWQVGNGQMPHLIYPQATGTRPSRGTTCLREQVVSRMPGHEAGSPKKRRPGVMPRIG